MRDDDDRLVCDERTFSARLSKVLEEVVWPAKVIVGRARVALQFR